MSEITVRIDGVARRYATLGEAMADGRRLIGDLARDREAYCAARIRVGEFLLAIRDQCDHGEWYSFLHAIGINRKTAQKAMRLAEFARATPAAVEGLGVRQAEIAAGLRPKGNHGSHFGGCLGESKGNHGSHFGGCSVDGVGNADPLDDSPAELVAEWEGPEPGDEDGVDVGVEADAVRTREGGGVGVVLTPAAPGVDGGAGRGVRGAAGEQLTMAAVWEAAERVRGELARTLDLVQRRGDDPGRLAAAVAVFLAELDAIASGEEP